MIEPVADIVVWFVESVATALQHTLAAMIGKM